ncbi:MAG: enoyl-CoA hydratase/isomerase family protein [Burkholderiaceae bacterium]|nr:enoyl-CoA hydratase/isomerase family protein [Burkholderiaceae bacterium]
MDQATAIEKLALRNVTVTVNGSLGEFQLTRSSRLNACSTDFMEDVIAAADWFDTHESLKAVTVYGIGKAFCAGFDLDVFLGGKPEDVRVAVELGRQMIQRVSRMKALTVAAAHGSCIGGGMVLLAACDFRYAARDTKFFLPEVDLGVPLAWGGMPWLVREVGPVAAMELTLLCDPISAEALHRQGFLNGVAEGDDVLARASETAQRLARKSGFVLRATKEQVIAAKSELASTVYSFNDANLFYAAVLDEESSRLRSAYIAALRERKK